MDEGTSPEEVAAVTVGLELDIHVSSLEGVAL